MISVSGSLQNREYSLCKAVTGWTACARRLLRSRLRSRMSHLAGFDQLLHGPGRVLDWHIRIYSVLIKEVDYIGP